MPTDRQLAQILEAVARFSRGGRGGLSSAIARMIGGAFGPAGELVGRVADVMSGNRRLSQKDIQEAVKLLNEFGYEITPRGPATGAPPVSRSPVGMPPRRVGQPKTVPMVRQPGQQPPPLPSQRQQGQRSPLQQQVGQRRPGQGPPPLWGPETNIDTRRVVPRFANEEIETPESSNVFSFAFDADVGQLYVTYKAAGPLTNERSGPTQRSPSGYRKRPHVRGPTYAYGGAGRPIPDSLYRALKSDHSKGEFIWEHLRVRGSIHGHRYPYMLTSGELRDGSIYVPRKATARGFRVRTVAYVDTPIGSGYQESQLPERIFRR